MEDENIFKDALDLSDFETQCRYNYLDELLCNIDDEIMYLLEELEKIKIDLEIMETMENYENWNDTVQEKERIKGRINYLYKKYDVVYDKYDEVFLNILASLE